MGVADVDALECLNLGEIEAEGFECTLELASGAVGDLVPGLLAADVEAANVGVLLAPAVDFHFDLFGELAAQVIDVDAGAAVESPSGGFTWDLPCMSIEPSCGANGSNVVRSPDGIHFCPDGTPSTRGVTGPCDEYSPGAFRFALAIVSAMTQYPHQTLSSLVLSAQ